MLDDFVVELRAPRRSSRDFEVFLLRRDRYLNTRVYPALARALMGARW